MAKSTEDDLVLVDHQPGPIEESANIGADGKVFLGAMPEEVEAEANQNHEEGGVLMPGPDGEGDVLPRRSETRVGALQVGTKYSKQE